MRDCQAEQPLHNTITQGRHVHFLMKGRASKHTLFFKASRAFDPCVCKHQSRNTFSRVYMQHAHALLEPSVVEPCLDVAPVLFACLFRCHSSGNLRQQAATPLRCSHSWQRVGSGVRCVHITLCGSCRMYVLGVGHAQAV